MGHPIPGSHQGCLRGANIKEIDTGGSLQYPNSVSGKPAGGSSRVPFHRLAKREDDKLPRHAHFYFKYTSSY